MANLLDETLAYDQLDDQLLQQQKEQLAATIIILASLMGAFALLLMMVTIAVSREPYLHYTSMCSLLGAAAMCFRFIKYYTLFQQTYNWQQLFTYKYKLWQTLAISLGIILIPLTCIFCQIIIHYT